MRHCQLTTIAAKFLRVSCCNGQIKTTFLLLTVFLLPIRSAFGQVPPQQADQAAINSAIQKGVQFLKSSQNPSGSWGTGTKVGGDGGWMVGYTALAGITLIECGTSPSEPGLQAAAQGVRSLVLELDSTYEVALAILFLDRMGEKNDRKLIQFLAGRLIAGQSSTGGWGYKVPKKSRKEVENLLVSLRKLSPPQSLSNPSPRERPATVGMCIKTSEEISLRPAPAFDFDKSRTALLKDKDLPVWMKQLPLLFEVSQLLLEDPKGKDQDPVTPTTDNSNTHFATLALWAARKHDVPTDRSFAMLANRFRTSQAPDGTWAYAYARNPQNGGLSSMTCVALLGLAIGQVLTPDLAVKPEQDPRVINAFTALSKRVGEPAGRIEGRPTPESQGGLYFLWSMERIAVLYDVQQLDKKDWYLWGAEILLCHQKTDGSWEKGGYHGENPVISTCFALLFLKRANLTPDLSRRFAVDTSALTKKVTTAAPPAPVVSSPRPPEPTPVAIEIAPAPRPLDQKPKVERVAAEITTPVIPPPEAKLNFVWIAVIVVLVPVSGLLAFLVFRKKQASDAEDENDDEEEEEEKPTKKGKKSSVVKAAKPIRKAKTVTKRPKL
jgi:hypothetical protein